LIKIIARIRGERLLIADNPRMKSPKYTILVVDDEESIRNLIVTFLSEVGHSHITATDGVDALYKMEGNKVDAVVTDIKMPDMDGITLTTKILKQYPGLPVMVMIGFDEESSAGVAISMGAREFIKKPFSPEEFEIRLKKMINDSEILRRMKSEKNVDENIQESMNEVETLKRTKGENNVDEDKRELRQHPRYSPRLRIDFWQTPDVVEGGFVNDMSEAGLGIQSVYEIPIGAELGIRVYLSKGEFSFDSIEGTGRIIWRTAHREKDLKAYRYGMYICKMASNSRDRLMKYIKMLEEEERSTGLKKSLDGS
jgi:DNA-binding response OmpR family regulator